MASILCDNYRLPLPVRPSVRVSQVTQPIAHTSSKAAAGSDKRQLSYEIRALY